MKANFLKELQLEHFAFELWIEPHSTLYEDRLCGKINSTVV